MSEMSGLFVDIFQVFLEKCIWVNFMIKDNIYLCIQISKNPF